MTLVDGSEHVVVHPEDVTARDALESLLEGPDGGWFYIGRKEWVRRNAVVRAALEAAPSRQSDG